ncbi:MAG: gliding motility-associated C-terminal domain-containing protein [Bacteroidetes bacterium]|nr:gliding motility-associated C-terminal domain-containing protein [Bacteroidota bacterium]
MEVRIDCDSFEVLVFGEKLLGGGFSVIDSFVDLGGTVERSIGAESAKDWKLYAVLRNKCDGVRTVSAVINVDNAAPEGVAIDSVSVGRAGNVVVGWRQSISKDISEYVLYSDSKGGLSKALDTVGLGLYYETTGDTLMGTSGAKTIRIAAFDSCGIGTGPVDPHSTVFLELVDADYCDRTVNLKRTNYEGWKKDSLVYRLVYTLDTGGTAWKELQDFSYNDLFLDLRSMKINMYVKVQVKDKLTGFTSSSNVVFLAFGDDRILDTLYVTGTSFLSVNGGTVLQWSSNRTTLVERFDIELYNNAKKEWNRIKTKRAVFSARQSDTLVGLEGGDALRVRAISDCGDMIGISNVGSVMGLDAKWVNAGEGAMVNASIERERNLRWNGYRDYALGVERYDVLRQMDGNWVHVASVTDTFYKDMELLTDMKVDTFIRYRVMAIERDSFVASWRGKAVSNTIEIAFVFHGATPNAFFVGGTDDPPFSIAVEGLDSTNSYLSVYNRWGEEIMNGDLYWNGGKGNDLNKRCAEGMYFFVAKVALRTKEVRMVSGSIMLLSW